MGLDELNETIKKFIRIEFPYLQPYPEYIDYMQLEYSLKVFILWDRYNKKEPIIDGLDFVILRNVLNRFNTRNLLNFLSEKSNAHLYIHYFEVYGEEDAKNQNDAEYSKLFKEMEAFYEEADKYVKLQLDDFRQSKKRVEEQPDFSLFQDDINFLDNFT